MSRFDEARCLNRLGVTPAKAHWHQLEWPPTADSLTATECAALNHRDTEVHGEGKKELKPQMSADKDCCAPSARNQAICVHPF
jgi:hypothetical protein